MEAAGTINDILNFIIPFAVWGFLAYIIYRIPIVTEGVDRFREWLKNRKEGGSSSNSSYGGGYKSSIGYE